MNNIIKKLLLFLAIPCAIVAAGYFALIRYYQNNIPYGTWINRVYCTGMTYDEAADLLLENHEHIVELDVIDCDGTVYSLKPDSSVYTVTYKDGLAEQIISYGAGGLFSEKYIEQDFTVQVDKDALYAYLDELPLFQTTSGDSEGEARLHIVETEDGFELHDRMENVLDTEKAYQVISRAIEAKEVQISLVDTECYYKPEYTSEDNVIITEFNALQDFCNKFVLELTVQGETVYTVDGSVLKDWILLESNGEYAYGKGGILLLDESRVKEYAQNISEEMTTYWGKPWQFINHNGDTIEVEAGNFGRVMNTSNLSAKLINAFDTGSSGSYELEFKFYPKSAAEVDYGAGVGDSYVEVDIKEQHVYLYIDGKCVLDSPCVTGNVSWNMETPTGVFYIEYKQRNRTLRGPGYATPVSYWMHFYNHCGFHDAGWRKNFGEDIYLKDGSHGCVNMPPAKAKQLYEQVYAGMPVVVY